VFQRIRRTLGRLPGGLDARELATAWLHLGVLWSFAVAQPLLDLLGDAPEFFVARENTRVDIIVLGLVLVLVPPLVLVALEALAGLVSAPLRRGLHVAFVGLLAATFVLQLLKDTGGSAAVLIPVALALGLLAAAAYARTRPGPMLLNVLSPAPVVFLALFLLVSPVSRLVLPGSDVEASDVAIPGDTPVVMIVYDELSGATLMDRGGSVNRRRFPHFAELARSSTWYRNATTVADFTSHAVPALLTGELPARGAAPIAADHPESIYTLLGGKYDFDVTEPVTDVCPAKLCPDESSSTQPFGRRARELASDLSLVSLHLVLPDNLASDLPPVDRSFGDFRELGEATTGRGDPEADARRGLAALVGFTERVENYRDFNERLGDDAGGARFHFLHVQMPHNPYYLLPDVRRYPETLAPLPGLDSPGAAGTWRDDPWLTRQALQRYLLQLRAGDRLLGQAIARMRASGLWDRALVVVTADHGVNFEPGQSHRAAAASTLPQIASVPLFVKAPRQDRGRVSDANVKSIDILPTIAARLGVRLPWSTAGRDADDAGSGGRVLLRPEFRDDDLSLPFAEFVRRRDRVVESIAERTGDTTADLDRVGPDPDLLGLPLARLGTLEPGGRFELDAGGLYSSVDPDGPVVPAFVTGRASRIPRGSRLAVTIDGVVRATTRPFDEHGPGRFGFVVPASAFSRGPNAVGVLAVTGSGSARRFLRLEGVGLDYRLVSDGGSEALVDPAGTRIPVVGSASGGQVDSATADDADVHLRGWAGLVRPPRSADRVVAFAGRRFIAGVRAELERPDLEKRYGAALANAGFEIRAGVSGPPPGSAGAPFHVYAIVGRRAYSLGFPKVSF
jgi:hypothetical protein